MSIKYTNSNQNVDRRINQTLTNIMLSRFKKGLALQNQEDGATSDQEDEDKSVSIVDPNKTMKLPRSKSKSYSVTRTTLNVKNKINSDKGVEFIQQSKVLNNELDHMLGLMKLNNKEQFYEKPYVKGSGIISGGALLPEIKDNLDKMNKEEISSYLNEKINVFNDMERGDEESNDGRELIAHIEDVIAYYGSRFKEQFVPNQPLDVHDVPSPVPPNINIVKPGDIEYKNKIPDKTMAFIKGLDKHDIIPYYNECKKAYDSHDKPGKKLKDNLAILSALTKSVRAKVPKVEVPKVEDTKEEDKDNLIESKSDVNDAEHKADEGEGEGEGEPITSVTTIDPFVAFTPETKQMFESMSIIQLKHNLQKLKTTPYTAANHKIWKENIKILDNIIKQHTIDSLTYQERNRINKKGEIEQLGVHNKGNLKHELSGANNDIKIKNNMRVVGQVDVKNIPNDVLLVTKKISNIITLTLIPLAQYLANIKYTTLSNGDVVGVKNLYKEIDEKMYILTTTNNKTNDMFIRLDKEFDKLYDLVKYGIQNYSPTLMYSGGSMLKRQSQTINRQAHLSRNLLNHAYYL